LLRIVCGWYWNGKRWCWYYLADDATCQGINNSGVYLSSNGVIIKCENASVGTIGNVGGIDYFVVENGSGTYGGNSTILDSIINGSKKVCTSKVTDLTRLFFYKHDFNQPIDYLDVSNITIMEWVTESFFM
jgi:hypothetical protein